MKNKILIMVLFSSFIMAHATDSNGRVVGMTEKETEDYSIIQYMGRSTDPPPSPIRNIAEFERMSGVLIRYPFGISTSLIREMAEDVKIYCLVSSSSQNSAYNSMNGAGVDMDNVEFITGSTDSYWTRDYGPWWVVDGNHDVGVVDFTYNRPRPNDNNAPQKVADYLDAPYFSSDLVAAGGNYMTDGYGISASSSLIYDENSMSNNQVHGLMSEYYGVHTYHVVDDPNNTYIDHIDCWGKYLSPHKVLIREVPTSHAQYDEIEEVAEYFANTHTMYGQPWELHRVYTPSDQPYTNSLILNDKVLVPIINSSWDDDALDAYEEAMPGYEVIGFTGSWQSTDALHCRAKGIPDLEMLQIFHGPLPDYNEPQDLYRVDTIIDDLSESGLIDEELELVWWTDEMDESLTVNLSVCPEDIPDCYLGYIPNQSDDTNIHYYIKAADYSGRVERLPISGQYSFSVVGGLPAAPGDINNDGIVNILDVVLSVNIVLNTYDPTPEEFYASDMNSDGIVNILDIIIIVNLIIG